MHTYIAELEQRKNDLLTGIYALTCVSGTKTETLDAVWFAVRTVESQIKEQTEILNRRLSATHSPTGV